MSKILERVNPLVVMIAGKSGSGKTTLVEKLIMLLTDRGHNVGSIKRTHHKVKVDTTGKDSYRFKEAGSVVTALVSDKLLSVTEVPKAPPALGEVTDLFKGKVDIVIVEGFYNNSGDKPDVTLLFAGNETKKVDGYIFTGKTPSTYEGKLCFSRDDATSVADWIEHLVAG